MNIEKTCSDIGPRIAEINLSNTLKNLLQMCRNIEKG